MAKESNVFKRLLRLIPPYREYTRRETEWRGDTRLRTRIALVVARCERVVAERVRREMWRDSDTVAPLEQCRKAMDTLAGRIRYAPVGHAGITSDHSVTENDLQEITRRDFRLMEMAQDLEHRVADLTDGEITAVVERMRRVLDERNDFIREPN